MLIRRDCGFEPVNSDASILERRNVMLNEAFDHRSLVDCESLRNQIFEQPGQFDLWYGQKNVHVVGGPRPRPGTDSQPTNQSILNGGTLECCSQFRDGV